MTTMTEQPETEPQTEPAPEPKPEPEPTEQPAPEDAWAAPCPVCGLLGCRKGHV
jgi:hypothetical protein